MMALRLAILFVIFGSIESRPSIFPMPSVSVIGDSSSSPISGASADPIPGPVISVSNSSKEGIDIANRINHLFKSIEREPGEPDQSVATNLNGIGATPESGSSQLKLNLNLDVEVQNGKPSRLALPNGELVIMFLPKRGSQNQPGGQPDHMVLSQAQLEKFMSSTTSQTNLIRMPNGGLLFTAFTPYSEQKESQDRPSSNSQKSISESSENITQPRAVKTKQKKKEEKDKFRDTQTFHSALETNPEVIENWNQGRVPMFPNFHGIDTETFGNVADEEDVVDKFPQLASERNQSQNYRRVGNEDSHQDMNSATKGSNEQHVLTEMNNLNHVNVVVPGRFRPVGHTASAVTCKQDDSTGGKRICKERTPNPCNSGTGSAFGDRNGGNCGGQNDGRETGGQSNEGENMEGHGQDVQLKRPGQAGQNMEGHAEVGQEDTFGLSDGPRMTKLNDDFIGKFDENLESGHVGSGHVGQDGQDKNLVPFSQPQTQMNMADVRLSTTRKPAARRTTSATITSTLTPTTTTSTALVTRDLHEMMVEQVMGMDHHSLADALMDPMMMMMGAMIALSGAYIAIAMQELNAANAAVLSQIG